MSKEALVHLADQTRSTILSLLHRCPVTNKERQDLLSATERDRLMNPECECFDYLLICLFIYFFFSSPLYLFPSLFLFVISVRLFSYSSSSSSSFIIIIIIHLDLDLYIPVRDLSVLRSLGRLTPGPPQVPPPAAPSEVAGEARKLPVWGMREQLLAAIHHNQVILVCGETGSGKTTQVMGGGVLEGFWGGRGGRWRDFWGKGREYIDFWREREGKVR